MPSFVYSLFLFVFHFILAISAGKGRGLLEVVTKALLPIVIMIFLIQSFFYPGEIILWSWSIFGITREGVNFSLILSSRILVIGSSVALFFLITPIKDFIYSLEVLGLHPKATYVVLSTLTIIPETRKLSRQIMDAQKTRGVETEGKLKVRAKAFLPTIAPLILTSFSNTEERAITLESRAFTLNVKKTSLHHLDKTKKDKFVRFLIFIVLILLILWRFFI